MSPQTSAARKLEGAETGPLLPRVTDGIPYRRPLRVGIISNPLSGQNLRRGLHTRIRDALRAHPQVVHVDARTLGAIQAAARELVEQETEIIAVNGGDGTMQAVLTAVMGAATDRLPVFAVLAGGTTNSTARNVGFGQLPLDAVERLLNAAAQGSVPGVVMTHPVLRADIENETQYAMMFGAAAVYHGIVFTRSHIETRGLRGEVGGGLAVGAFIWKALTGSGGTLFPPLQASIEIDGRPIPPDRYLGIIASTMTRQILGIRPYWGEGSGPLRFSAISCNPKHMSRAMIPAIRGKASPWLRPEFGYRSVNATEVKLLFDNGFTLDGELFPPGEGLTQVTLSARQCCYFLRDRG